MSKKENFLRISILPTSMSLLRVCSFIKPIRRAAFSSFFCPRFIKKRVNPSCDFRSPLYPPSGDLLLSCLSELLSDLPPHCLWDSDTGREGRQSVELKLLVPRARLREVLRDDYRDDQQGRKVKASIPIRLVLESDTGVSPVKSQARRLGQTAYPSAIRLHPVVSSPSWN